MSRASVNPGGFIKGSMTTVLRALLDRGDGGGGEGAREEDTELDLDLDTNAGPVVVVDAAGYTHFSFRSLHALHVGLVSSHLIHVLVTLGLIKTWHGISARVRQFVRYLYFPLFALLTSGS